MMSAESQNRLREIDVLNFEHTAIVPVCEAKPKRKKKPGMKFEHKLIIGQWFVIGALAVMNYILQVGAI